MLADLLRRENESWADLLLRLNAAVMQCVVDGRVIMSCDYDGAASRPPIPHVDQKLHTLTKKKQR